MVKKILYLSVLTLLISTRISYAEPEKEKNLEQALLMQLSHEIRLSLKEHFQQEFVQYDCEKITEIEMIKLPEKSRYLSEGKTYKIKVELRVKGSQDKLVTMTLYNAPGTTFYKPQIFSSPIPKDYKCSP